MFNGWLFDIYSGKGGMTLWLIDADGAHVRLIDRYRPSFFVGGTPRTLERVKQTLQRSRAPASFRMTTRRDFWTARDVPVLQVSASVSIFNSVVRQVARIDGAELYNCDIVPEQMYLYEKGLFPLAPCEVDHSNDGVVRSIRACAEPEEIDYSLPPMEVLKLTVETNGANPNFGGVGCALRAAIDGRDYLLDSGELLDTLEGMLIQYDPDVILTEWGDSFIIPRLWELARRQEHPLSLNRDAGRNIATRRSASYFSYGRIFYRAPAKTLFGRWHIDARNSFITSQTGLEGLFELARLSKIPVQRLARTSPGTGISSMQLDMAMRDGVLIPWRKRMPEEFKTGLELLVTDKGGLVYIPQPGVYDEVMEIDFASMYPAIMVNHNISPETVNCACCDGEPVPEIGHRVCRRRRGLVPRVLEPILEKRRVYKELSKRADDAELKAIYKRRQTALKWMLVTCFGYLGYKNARFGRIEAHESVTALGREKLLQAKEIAERRGFEMVHAIVDSLWVRKPGMTEREGEQLMDEISMAVDIPLGLEGNYRWIAFVPSRMAPNVAVANRYFGLFDTGEMKLRGLEVRRSDMPPIVKNMQNEMLRALCSASNAQEFRQKEPEVLDILRRYLRALRRGDVATRDLVITQRLSKDPATYKTNTATAAASKALLAAGIKPQAGEKVQLIIIDSGAQGQITKAIPYTPGVETLDKYDTDKYAELLIRAAESILLRRTTEEEIVIVNSDKTAESKEDLAFSQLHLSLAAAEVKGHTSKR